MQADVEFFRVRHATGRGQTTKNLDPGHRFPEQLDVAPCSKEVIVSIQTAVVIGLIEILQASAAQVCCVRVGVVESYTSLESHRSAHRPAVFGKQTELVVVNIRNHRLRLVSQMHGTLVDSIPVTIKIIDAAEQFTGTDLQGACQVDTDHGGICIGLHHVISSDHHVWS